MKKFKNYGILLLIILLSSCFIFAVINQKRDLLHQGTAMHTPLMVDLAGEYAPLYITDVKERLDRELLVNNYMQASTILIIKRANRAFPIIEPILKKNGVPDDFKYLAVIESSLTNAVSPSGAKGYWQFLTDTARERGLEVSDNIDERYNLEKATDAACKYLIDAKAKLGSWTLAAASYNCGMTGITNRINNQKVKSYYDLALTDETSRYIFRLLALKEIMKNPVEYGYKIYDQDLYQPIPTKKVVVDSDIDDLATFAIKQGINYKILKLENPWLREDKLEVKNGKKYIISIPTDGY